MKVRGMGFVDAVEVIGGIRASPVFYSLPSRNSEIDRNPKILRLPPSARYSANMLSYLQNRGISAEVIRCCIDAGILYEGQHNGPVCVFVGKDEAGQERFAFMRGIYNDLKQDCAGSDKRFSFKLAPGSPDCGDLKVFESPIDSMSHLCLFPGTDAHRLSLGGTSPVALVHLLENQPQIQRVTLCLDADDAGQTGVRKIQGLLAGDERFSSLEVNVQPSPAGKDYSDFLLHTIKQERLKNLHNCQKDDGLLT
jgi:hypothetical protein